MCFHLRQHLLYEMKIVTNKQRTQINLNKTTMLKLIQMLISKQEKLIHGFILCLWDVKLYRSLI